MFTTQRYCPAFCGGRKPGLIFQASAGAVIEDLRAYLAAELRRELGAEGEVRAEHWSVSCSGDLAYVTLRAECRERIDIS